MSRSVKSPVTLLFLSVGAVSLLQLAGCVAPAIIPPAPVTEVRAIEMGQESRPLRFDKIVVRLPQGHVIGRSNMSLGCFDESEELVYKGGRSLLDPVFFQEAFREELLAARYTVVGDPNALFEDRDADRAELIVGGIITDVKANICYNSDGISRNYTRASGQASMEVEWQILDQLSRRTVYQETTTGVAELKKTIPNGDNELLLMAFSEATKALLADDKFYALASRKTSSSTVSDETPKDFTTIPMIEASSVNFQDGITLTRARVATVRSGGHGTGFFVSNNFLLTNEHVVGGANIVAVRLVTGRELVGEVVATNSARDVALVRREPCGLVGLPLRTAEPRVGDRVFVVGSPKDEDLESTVSGGIISAFRSLDGLRYIQSDTNVLPGNSGGPMFDEQGNVIAITVAGLFGEGSGLNLFIPIAEALRALNIERVDD